jgi:molybdate transport system substrate-binding protein
MQCAPTIDAIAGSFQRAAAGDMALLKKDRCDRVPREWEPFIVGAHCMRPGSGVRGLIVSLCCLVLFARPVLAGELLVAAAVSLKESMSEIAGQFKKTHPDTDVVFNFAASGQLAQQIRRGAPVDVFASAGKNEIDMLNDAGLLLKGSEKYFASNRLVVIVPALPSDAGISNSTNKTSASGKPAIVGAMPCIARLEDLLRLDKISIGSPQTVPAGYYAEQALTQAHLYDRLQKHLVFGESARQVLAYVESGEVDAGLVYATDAKISKRVKVCMTLPESACQPILYPIAIIKDSQHKDLAREFVDLVMSKAGRSVLAARGFCAPKGSARSVQ